MSRIGQNIARNWIWILIGLMGGIFMIVGGGVGGTGLFETLHYLILPYIPVEFQPLFTAFKDILVFIAGLGGWAVIGGIVLIILLQYRVGRFIMSVGLTFGLLGLIIWIINATGLINVFTSDPYILTMFSTLYGYFAFNTGFAFVGVIFGIISRYGLRRSKLPSRKQKDKMDKKKGEVQGDVQIEEPAVETLETADTEISEDVEDTSSTPLKNKYCPNCGAILPTHANFCSQCGKTF